MMEYRSMENTLVVRLDPGEEILEQVKAVSLREHIQLATVQGIGAVNDLTVGVFDTAAKEYHANRFQGSYEIVSLSGTISTMDGAYYCHLHMSAGDGQGHAGLVGCGGTGAHDGAHARRRRPGPERNLLAA